MALSAGQRRMADMCRALGALCVLSALLGCVSASSVASRGAPVCNLVAAPGTSFVGSYRSGSEAGTVVTMTVGPLGMLVFATDATSIYMQSSQWADSVFHVSELVRHSVTTGLKTTSPCAAGSAGNYTYYTNDDCQTLTLRVIFDSCADRSSGLNSMTLNRQPVPDKASYAATCAIASTDALRSNTTGQQTSVMFLPTRSAILNTTNGDVFVFSGVLSPDSTRVEFRDIYVPDENSFSGLCNDTIAGAYSLLWIRDCTGFRFKAVDDACTRRLIQLDQLFVKRNYTAPFVKKKRPASQLAGNWDNAKLIGALIVLVVSIVLMGAMCACLSASKVTSSSSKRRSRSRSRAPPPIDDKPDPPPGPAQA